MHFYCFYLTSELIKNEYLREGQSYTKVCPHTSEVNEQKMFEVETGSFLDWCPVGAGREASCFPGQIGKSQFHLSSRTIDKLQSSKQTLETFSLSQLSS